MGPFESTLTDLRYAARQCRREWRFALIVIAVLALTIGGNTAIFTLMRAVLAPLPIPDADRVVMVWTENPAHDWHHFPASIGDALDWQASGVFSALGAFRDDGFNLRLDDRTERVAGLRAMPEVVEALGIKAERGRVFAVGDAAMPVAMLSDRLWRATFNARPEIIGQSIVLDGVVHTVIGVLPPNTPKLGHEDLYVPLHVTPGLVAERGSRSFGVIGRLSAGTTLGAAQARMDTLSRQLAERYPREDGGGVASLQPVQDAFVEDARLLLAVLEAAVACAWAIACANVAGLLLARGVARRRELAIRTALGGGRWRLTRQLLTENVLIATLAGLAAFAPAWWIVKLVASYRLEELPNAALAKIDGWTVALNLGIAVVTGVLCGVVPAWLAWRNDPYPALKGGPVGTLTRTHHRLRGVFVAGQLALTVLLLVGGGLMLRSLMHLVRDSPGYSTDHVVTMTVALSDSQYKSTQRQTDFFSHLVDRVRELPGVSAASATQELPTSDDVHGSGIIFPSQPEPRVEDTPLALHNVVVAGYFGALRIPVVRGRDFSPADGHDAPPVAIIDEWTAARYWHNQDPVGQQFKTGLKQPWRQIVGVVGDVEAPLIVRFLKGRVAQLYIPLAQEPVSRMTLVVRAQGDASAALNIVPSIRKVVRDMDVDQPVFDVNTLADVRMSGRRVAHMVTLLLDGFAVMALVLASLGLYGTIAYDVSRRTREFGLRLSLGAHPSSVLRLILWQSSRMLLAGMVLGAVAALFAVRLLATLLQGVGTNDPLTFLAAILILSGSGLLASCLPALRAMRVNPIEALRQE